MSLRLAAATSAAPISASATTVLNFIEATSFSTLVDARLLQLVELVRVGLPQPLQHPQRLGCLLLVDLAQGEPDVDQDIVAQLGRLGVREQTDVHVAADPSDLDLGDLLRGIDDLDDLARNREAHVRTPP